MTFAQVENAITTDVVRRLKLGFSNCLITLSLNKPQLIGAAHTVTYSLVSTGSCFIMSSCVQTSEIQGNTY